MPRKKKPKKKEKSPTDTEDMPLARCPICSGKFKIHIQEFVECPYCHCEFEYRKEEK